MIHLFHLLFSSGLILYDKQYVILKVKKNCKGQICLSHKNLPLRSEYIFETHFYKKYKTDGIKRYILTKSND